jgi:hypothetical protein
VRTLISPWSGRDFDGRTSSTALSTRSSSPGRTGPAEFVEPCPDDAAGRLEIALEEEPHHGGGRMPTARCEAAEHSAARGRLVEMKRLGIELRGNVLIRSFSIRIRAAPLNRCPGAKSSK